MNKPRPYKVSLTKGEILNALSNSVSFKDASIYLKISLSLLRFHCIHYDKDGDLRDYYKLKYNRKSRQGKSPKKLTREKILEALNATRSNLAAARYLGMDVRTLRNHAKDMLDDDGNPILDLNKNHSAVGIPKFGLRKGTRLDILSAMELALVQKWVFASIYAYSNASLYSYKIQFGTNDYVNLVAYGGIRFMTFNYDDAEWDNYLKNNTLDYTK